MRHLAHLGRGLGFPFGFSKRTGGTEESSDLDRIRESILQILETRPGERIMRPEFGSRVKNLVFEQNDAVLKALVRHYVVDAIQRWEKRVVATGVEFEGADSNQLLVHIGYRIVTTGMEGSMVWSLLRE